MNDLKLLSTPFAQNGIKRNIINEPASNTPKGQATYKTGFPEITMTPITNGGIPPSGADFNGLFNDITKHLVYLNQGGRYKFNQALCDKIGGYKKGAILLADDEQKEYINLIDNNTVNFNTATEEEISGKWDKYTGKEELLNGYNGYCKLSNGLIIQWGIVNTGVINTIYHYFNIVFPIAFSRNPFVVIPKIFYKKDIGTNIDFSSIVGVFICDYMQYDFNGIPSIDFAESVNASLVFKELAFYEKGLYIQYIAIGV